MHQSQNAQETSCTSLAAEAVRRTRWNDMFNRDKKTSMTTGIIGTGSIGQAIAKRLASAGIPAAISNSRGPRSLSSIMQGIGAGIMAAELRVAAKADVVFLAVPWSAHADAVAGLRRPTEPLLWTRNGTPF
jgi:prephenate dehydrogenase